MHLYINNHFKVLLEKKFNIHKQKLSALGVKFTISFFNERYDRTKFGLISKDDYYSEITDLLKKYLKNGELSAEILGRGSAWLDTGSIESFHKTSNFVSSIQNQQGFKIACIEEIAYLNKWIGVNEIKNSIKFYGKCEYSKYLSKIISNK